VVKRLVAIAYCLVLAACAAGGAKKSMAPPAAESHTAGAADAPGTSPLPGSTRDQIQQLDDQITISRAKLELEEPTAAAIQSAPVQPMGALPAQQDPKCKPAKNDTCTTSCTLSDSICGNANKICELAKSMPGDNWALNKCAKANTTCEQSRTKCCGCQ
jgi:hypothetical protein